MSPLLLGAVGASLVISIVLGVIAFLQAGQGQRLRGRIQAAGGLALGGQAGPAMAELPSIRVAQRNERAWLTAILRLMRYYPDAAAAYKLPWWVVVAGACVIAAFSALRLSVIVGALPAIGIGLVSAFLLARTVFNWQFSKYRDAAFAQIPDALGLMVRTVRAGLPMAEALRSVSREIAFPTSEEFGRVVGDIAIGRPLDQSLLRLSERTQLTEYAFLAVTLGLQQQTGGSLAETLDNLADTVRKRVGITKRAKALAAEARMQAGILAVLPFLSALAMSAIQPFYIETFTDNPTGRKMAVVGFVFLILGLLTIRWLIKRAGTD
ncbi:MAG: type II secretion system F family protein [Acetobacteraceae bacterium]|nr:type II secretion system F family protein [Acetobacteraceae bacterium]